MRLRELVAELQAELDSWGDRPVQMFIPVDDIGKFIKFLQEVQNRQNVEPLMGRVFNVGSLVKRVEAVGRTERPFVVIEGEGQELEFPE